MGDDNNIATTIPAAKEEDGIQMQAETSSDRMEEETSSDLVISAQKIRNINSYYGHRVGFWQMLSLVLNAGLMLFAHLGHSATILSSLAPVDTSSSSSSSNNSSNNNNNSSTTANDSSNATFCNAQDTTIWTTNGGITALPSHSDFCSRTFNTNGCLADNACIETCFRETYGYSPDCSTCFGSIPSCGVKIGCTWVCIADGTSDACQECLVPCVEEFYACSGLPEAVPVGNTNAIVGGGVLVLEALQNNGATGSIISSGTTANACNDYDLNGIKEWYTVYELTFVKSVQDAWNGGAKFLAVVIVFFSGFWPYAKNILLAIIWYVPMSVEQQTWAILWLSRLSKYTLVDVFAVIGVLVGVQLQLNVAGVEVVIRAEPRFGVLAFFLATVWEFLQIEWIKILHERKVLGVNSTMNVEGNGGGKLLFSQIWIPSLILLASIGLYAAAAVTELVFIESSDFGIDGSCLQSYTLVTLGNALINEMSMVGNSVPGQTWLLYLVYIVLVLALPVLTHVLQLIFIIGWSQSKKLKRMIQWTSAIWCFACIEVLLIGILAVESKFEELILKIAGDDNARFLDIQSGLGAGFYVLLAYSVVAGFLQFSLLVRYDAPSEPSPESEEVAKKESNPV